MLAADQIRRQAYNEQYGQEQYSYGKAEYAMSGDDKEGYEEQQGYDGKAVANGYGRYRSRGYYDKHDYDKYSE